MSIEERLKELGVELLPPPKPVASYVPVVVSGRVAFLAGQGAIVDGEVMYPGHVGAEVTIDQANEAARRCGLQALAALKEELGSLDRVSRIVNLTVYVSSAPGFTQQPVVANGASDLLIEVFGEAGRHARTAVGVPELPLNLCVEVSVIAEVD
ncbi:MAG: RidA family protein [Actinomycetota bacterium]|nr:RidA family protein [Actinomycetota bacterium]